jgi:hypothetical protein
LPSLEPTIRLGEPRESILGGKPMLKCDATSSDTLR